MPERQTTMPEGQQEDPEPEGQQAVNRDGVPCAAHTHVLHRAPKVPEGADGVDLGDARNGWCAKAGGSADRDVAGGAEAAAAGAEAAGGACAAVGARAGSAVGTMAAVGVVPRELWSGGAAGWGARHDGQAAGAG